MNGIVVGVDESDGAQHALRWAHSYGRERGQMVTALMAWDYIGQRHADGKQFDPDYSAEVAEQELGKMVERALGPDSGVAAEAVLDKPETALVEASKGADLVVVGARGLGGFRGLLLGSVSRHVLHYAESPVAVIRDDVPPSDGPIVVGVNGSEHSVRALGWAADLAAESGRRLVAVWAWQVPIMGGELYPVMIDYPAFAEGAAEGLRNTLEQADLGAVDVEQRVAEGQPASLLLATAEEEHASLIVVGARGTTGVAGALLGSVSDQITRHAKVPVVVIP